MSCGSGIPDLSGALTRSTCPGTSPNRSPRRHRHDFPREGWDPLRETSASEPGFAEDVTWTSTPTHPDRGCDSRGGRLEAILERLRGGGWPVGGRARAAHFLPPW